MSSDFLLRALIPEMFGQRAVNALAHAGITTLGQLVQWKPRFQSDRMSRFEGIGKVTEREIMVGLEGYGLRLGMSLSEYYESDLDRIAKRNGLPRPERLRHHTDAVAVLLPPFTSVGLTLN